MVTYMGGKHKIAKLIVEHIIRHNPNTKYFYDLFGGGGAVTQAAVESGHFKKVYYNEIDPSITEFLKLIVSSTELPMSFYKFISRDEFKEIVQGNDAYSGFVKLCWSYGSNFRKGYLYSKDNSAIMELYHNVVFYNCLRSAEKLHLNLSILPVDIDERRLYFVRNLQRIEHIKRVLNISQMLKVTNNSNFEKITFSSLDYLDVEIETPVSETILYLDPPYVDTAKYGSFCKYTLQEYINRSKYKIYLSEYKNTYRLQLANSFETTTNIGQGSKKVTELLFTNFVTKT